MTQKRKDKFTEDRRDFLKLAGLGSVVGGAAIATGGISETEAGELKEGSGYRETAHVKTYYDLSRF